MSKHVRSAPTTARRTIERTTSVNMPASKHKANKTPCSLCHQVVEELKYHYDICEPCHQNEAQFDMDVLSNENELEQSSDDYDESDLDWDDEQSGEQHEDHIIEDSVVLKRENEQ